MNTSISSLLKKATLLSGVLFLGWTAKAQSTGIPPSDTARHHGIQRHRGGPGIRYTPEQRKQLMAINKDYHQKSEDLFKKDNSTLKEYKAGLIALQNEKKAKIEALLTPAQKQERTTRKQRMSENTQVRAVAQMERLKLRLNLSDDQVAKIKAGQESLHNQAKAIRDDDNLLPREKREQMMSLITKRRDIVKSVLTPEQQSQYEKIHQHRAGRPGRPGGRGRMGGFGEDRHTGSEDQTK
jgi:Spy/CpxP family protein refolding chaperone